MDWAQIRHQLVSKLKETQLELRPPRRRNHDIESLRRLRGEFNLLLEEYVENVPQVPVSRCPICGEVLALTIDLAGLDSPWWWDACPEPFAPHRACEHFRVFLGALDLHGREPTEVDVWSVLPGPGAPFVIDRLLSMEGMQAVVSSLTIGSGDTGYLIAYFSAEPIPQTDLHQEWRRQTWVLYNEDGDSVAQDVVNDPWDFELAPWLESGKLSWIDAGDDSLTVHHGRPSPYDGHDGVRQKQMIGSGRVELAAAPDGTEPEYYAPF